MMMETFGINRNQPEERPPLGDLRFKAGGKTGFALSEAILKFH
jgi:hypothetical protein